MDTASYDVLESRLSKQRCRDVPERLPPCPIASTRPQGPQNEEEYSDPAENALLSHLDAT